MLNVTVIGTVKDEYGYLQSGTYQVIYKDREVISPIISTDNNQIGFSIGDHNHLGCNGTMRKGDVFYVDFQNYSGTKTAKRMYEYNDENVIILNTVAKDDWGLSVNLNVDLISGGTYRLMSNGTGIDNIFRVYICSNSMFETDKTEDSWKLSKTIKTTEKSIDIEFTKSTKTKIEVETVTDGHTSGVDHKIVEVTVQNEIHYIEWE